MKTKLFSAHPMLALSVLVILSVSGITLLTILRTQQALRVEVQQRADLLLNTLESVLNASPTASNLAKLSDVMKALNERDELLLSGYVYDTNGQMIARLRGQNPLDAAESDDTGERFIESDATVFEWRHEQIIAGRRLSVGDHPVGAVGIGLSTALFQKNSAALWIQGGSLALLIIILSILIAASFTRHTAIQSSQTTEEFLQKLEKAVETTEVGITITDNDGQIVYTNPADAKMHGYTVDELIGQYATIFASDAAQEEMVPEDDIQDFSHWKRERLNVRKDGSKFPVRLISNPITDIQGSPLGKVVVCEDITEYKQAEDALAKEHNLLHSLIDNLPDLIYVKDTNGRYLLANDALVRFMGVDSQEELLGKTDFDFHTLDMAKQYSVDEQKILESGRPLINREDPIIEEQTGSMHWLLSTKVPYRDGQGKIAGLVGINRDITGRKRIEAQLFTAHAELKEKNEQLAKLNVSKDKFFSIISHDLRSPLNVVLGYSRVIDDEFESSTRDEFKEYVKNLRESAEKLYTLLENLLTWSRIQRGVIQYSPDNLNFNDVAQETIELLRAQANQKHITLHNGVGSEIEIYADFYMLSTVLRNLLSNAIKFTSSGGLINVSAKQNNTETEVMVSDSGVGIPEEDISKLFRIDVRYTHIGTAGEEGTGLGLSLCKELIEKNGGTIWVESKIGAGATFHLTLPRTSESSPAQP